MTPTPTSEREAEIRADHAALMGQPLPGCEVCALLALLDAARAERDAALAALRVTRSALRKMHAFYHRGEERSCIQANAITEADKVLADPDPWDALRAGGAS